MVTAGRTDFNQVYYEILKQIVSSNHEQSGNHGHHAVRREGLAHVDACEGNNHIYQNRVEDCFIEFNTVQ